MFITYNFYTNGMAKNKGVFSQEVFKAKDDRGPYIKIYGVPKDIHDQLWNISDNMGIPLSYLLKPVLREWVEKQSERNRAPKPKY